MTSVAQAVAQRENSDPVRVLQANKARFAAVLPDHLDVDTFVGLTVGALYREPKLLEAATNSPASLMNALMRCASLGHQPGTEEFYLTPRKVKGVLQVQGIEGYRGIVERMYRSGAVASVIVREVCERDEFEFVEGEMDRPRHRIDWFAGKGGRGEMIGVYAYAILTTGAVSRVVILSRDDVMEAKAKSDAASSPYSPWNTNERAMWWKTAARRLEPWVPTSAEFRRELLRAAAQATGTTAPETTRGEDLTVTPPMVDITTGEIVDDDATVVVQGE